MGGGGQILPSIKVGGARPQRRWPVDPDNVFINQIFSAHRFSSYQAVIWTKFEQEIMKGSKIYDFSAESDNHGLKFGS